ncbi:MAG: phosphoglucosamine mutase [Gammaproteobacteria bacterium]
MQRKYFGTDGIRGQVGTGPINPEFIMKLGWAAGRVLGRGGPGKVIIGKDTRISGYMFESALESGLSAAGMDIRLLGPLPTPGIAYLTRSTRAVAGIVISASHNPFEDNGIKFFSSEGCKLPDDVELAIEAEFEQPMAVVASAKLGKARRIDDAPRRYMEFCKSSIAVDFNLAGVKIVLDCANGATYHIAPELFEELGATVISIADDPDGLNINDNCGATSPQTLQQAVLKHQADVGVAFDGDGDRVLMVDADGDILDGDELLYIMAVDDPEALRGAVVGTQMSNLGLELAVRTLGLDFLRTNVGDRYIYEAMCKHDLILGGETSGHILRLDLTTTGDGIISALQVLGVMQRQQRTLHELKSGMQKFPQVLVNVRLTDHVNGHAGGRNSVMELPVVLAAVSEAEKTLGKTGRVLLRPSGTEPLLRIMVEGEQAAQVQLLSEQLADVVRHEVNTS